MQPGEEIPVHMRYKSRGMESWRYDIPAPHEIRDFRMVMSLPEVARDRLDYPEGCLTPTEITTGSEGRGTVLTWTLDRAITTRGMGVELPGATQPGELVARVLKHAWRGAMLLLVGLVVSLLPGGVRMGLARIGVVGGAYCGQFMLLAALSDTRMGFIGALALGAVITLVLSCAALRWPVRVKGLAPWCLMAFFALAYSLLALPRKLAPALMTVVDVGLLVYLVGLYVGQARGCGRMRGEAGDSEQH